MIRVLGREKRSKVSTTSPNKNKRLRLHRRTRLRSFEMRAVTTVAITSSPITSTFTMHAMFSSHSEPHRVNPNAAPKSAKNNAPGFHLAFRFIHKSARVRRSHSQTRGARSHGHRTLKITMNDRTVRTGPFMNSIYAAPMRTILILSVCSVSSVFTSSIMLLFGFSFIRRTNDTNERELKRGIKSRSFKLIRSQTTRHRCVGGPVRFYS